MGIGAREILVLLVIALLLFGAKRLPALARSLGRSARILKTELKATDTGGQPGADADPGTDRARESDSGPSPRQAVAHAAAPTGPPLEGTVVSHRSADR
ncbi:MULTISPECIES: twin-arginine translocase TatA/TatE family subunit [Nocardiopsidaceae]|uniref:Sec-independent protein translocase protein TatA n=1 Tax=Streptomonospora nanhaiensis TaxID=1323731 RepID=A0ABY6YHW0_9ACTN|nr:twin-arginine translocase TatA/TatE family subunit [Streptomonospora nanhaiensis]WAE71848.1 twin-arginine translocase TatA/TatE family subunit [Streptomonospora nanhaiensis]